MGSNLEWFKKPFPPIQEVGENPIPRENEGEKVKYEGK
jgi:hypothetical protein